VQDRSHAVVEARFGDVGAGLFDRSRVDVEHIDTGLGVGAGDGDAGERCQVVQVGLVDEHRAVGLGQRVAARRRVRIWVVDGQEAGYSLLLEPLADVPLCGSGPGGQLGRCGGRALGERPVETKAAAEMYRRHLHGAHDRAEQAFDEGVGRTHGGCLRHGRPPSGISRVIPRR
jgi:hypothetical protein